MTTKTSTRHLGLRFAFLLLALLQVAGPVSYQTADLMLEAQGLDHPLLRLLRPGRDRPDTHIILVELVVQNR